MGRCKVAGFLWGLGGAGRRVELQVVSVSGAQCCGVRGRSRGGEGKGREAGGGIKRALDLESKALAPSISSATS